MRACVTGMAATTGTGSYSHAGADGMAHGHNRQLSSQWSFSRQDLPQISETGMIPDIGGESGGCNSSSASAQPYSYLSSRNFSVSSWDDTGGSIMFPSPGKKLKVDAAADDMVVTGFSSIDSQVRANVLLGRRCLLCPPHGRASLRGSVLC
jgi:hypothetical protein